MRREIAYHVANGDWLPDDVAAEDLLAAIVLRARRAFDHKPPGRDFTGWLLSVADDEIMAQLRQARRQHEDSLLDLSLLSGVPTPEQIVESEELQEYINRTLASLPYAWRHTFTLHYIDGLPVAEIARIMNRREEDVERDLEHAREYLRERLVESGLAPKGEEVENMFGTVAHETRGS